MIFGLDFETFCNLNLQKISLDTYVNHKSFRPVIAAVASRSNTGYMSTEVFDFVTHPEVAFAKFEALIADSMDQGVLSAHNASFERAVLKAMKISIRPLKLVDSAVIARSVGADSRLNMAASQLLGEPKMDGGERLVKKFCRPRDDGYVYIDHVEDWTDEDRQDWTNFISYCSLDAALTMQITELYDHIRSKEWRNEHMTQRMNEVGWFVDMDLVERMAVQHEANKQQILEQFQANLDPNGELNFRSFPQLQRWCKDRGVMARSFDQLNVDKMILRIRKRLTTLHQLPAGHKNRAKIEPLTQVEHMLLVKQALGGSSLTKLDAIKRLVSDDGRLRYQYVHVGAGQTFRTSGYGVQMQNLKRLPPIPGNVADLSHWSNDTLAKNLRQVFMAEHPQGQLIVADFSSIESRGLAYLADAQWKLDAYYKGRDMYKVLASQIYAIHYDSVNSEERRTGKVGELSCGYGAGGGAVKDFAEKMGVDFTLDEAAELVTNWRSVNPEIVKLWEKLDSVLHDVIEHGHSGVSMPIGPGNSWTLEVIQTVTPETLLQLKPMAKTITVALKNPGGGTVLTRWFQGCFMNGRDICYMKASELKGGPLWRDKWTKKGQSGHYKLYGGKLTGILVQSFCREMFFNSIRAVSAALAGVYNVQIIGQFHDELVVEWSPDRRMPNPSSGLTKFLDLPEAKDIVHNTMVSVAWSGFPLEAEVKTAHRYTK